MIDEPSAELTFKILQGIRSRYETHHQVKISDAALQQAVDLSGKFIKDRVFPDKAIDLMDEACARVKLQSLEGKAGSQKKSLVVNPDDIEAVFNEGREIGLNIHSSESKQG